MSRVFECLLQDDRYSVSQLSWIVVADLDRALELARRDLLSDDHHRSVEIRENGRLVLFIDRGHLSPTPPVRTLRGRPRSGQPRG
jgi:hypothetical protein